MISSGTISGAKVRLKNGAPTEMRLAGQRFEHQRIERADQHRRAAAVEEQIVEDQRALAADRREKAAGPQRGGAEGEEREGAADEHAAE